MNPGGGFIAIDWGTSNRRIYEIAGDGTVLHTERDDRGALAMQGADYAAEVAEIRHRFGDLPVLCAGMVGSRIGWAEVPYVPVPGGLRELASNTAEIAPAVFIVPGMSRMDRGRADVMRGEEVQFLGAAGAGMVPGDALLCQPGTHAKWATLRGARLVDFTTAMTGEVFALLRDRSLLSAALAYPVTDGTAFRSGVEQARRGDILASLFSIRAADLLGHGEPADGASVASGLLIGADVAARLGGVRDETVYLLADPILGQLYATAIGAHGARCVQIDSHAAFVAGILRIREHLP